MSDKQKINKWTALIIAIIIIAGSYVYVEKSKLDFNCKLYNVIHPSVFGRYIKYQIPNNYFKHLEEMKIEH